MEKQDLDNLQQTTKDYSDSAAWLSAIMLGTIFVIYGIMKYFNFGNYGVLSLLFVGGWFCWVSASRKLNRSIMNKGLGYVKQKEAFTSLKQKLSRKQILFLILFFIVIGLSVAIKNWKNWDDRTFYTGMFLVCGIISTIFGLLNRKKIFSLYVGIYFIVCGLILHIFYAHKMVPEGITDIFIGLGLILSGIIYYFKYKNIVQKVKGTN
ncbi:MAG: hypothetical protein PHX21_02945 [bacterium]|nr:hypothetical protein [bacterium]